MGTPKAIPLASHVDQTLGKYRRGIQAATAVLISLAFGGTVLVAELRTDVQILQAVSAHVASLVETQDRPELQRLAKSIGTEKNSAVMIVDDGIVYASSGSLSELDQPYDPPPSLRLSSQSFLTTRGLLTQIPLHRPNGPKQEDARIIMVTPLYSILCWSVFMALVVLAIGLLIGSMARNKLKHTIERALRPVADLDEAIRSLKTLRNPAALTPTAIMELDHIRDAILETHLALVSALDALAEKRAKELATEAYKRLIHDLHNPVAALQTLIKVTGLPHLTAEERKDSAERIPLIAEQILNQVTVARANLDFEAEVLKTEDIRACITAATELANLASPRFGLVHVESQIPDTAVVVAHDTQLLGRAVGNLVKNALDACRDRVRVVVKNLTDATTIEVMDDGPGLAQDQVGLYLQGRAKSTKNDRQAFGLATANHIIRAHGGRIIYRVSEMGGACFEIRLSR
ncbi:HAMP domain-containing sensor histidine kinase [Bdellovibrionota bacterium FG-1]